MLARSEYIGCDEKGQRLERGANVMGTIGCGLNPSFQQVATFDIGSGKLREQRLGHREQAEQFYCSLHRPVRLRLRKQ